METKQKRYYKQARKKYITEEYKEVVYKRLSERLSKDEEVQKQCILNFGVRSGRLLFSAMGVADVVKDNKVVYELKFKNDGLAHEDFIQCACYMIALGLEEGVLWNTQDNTAYSLSIDDKKAFMDALVKAATKGHIKKYYKPKDNVSYKDKEKAIKEAEKERKRNKRANKVLKRAKIERPLIEIYSTEWIAQFEWESEIVREPGHPMNRLIKCTSCENVKKETEFDSFGGRGRVSLGICEECKKKVKTY